MQLTPEQKAIFEQLGLHPAFRDLVAQEQREKIKVLKGNPVEVQLLRAQGAVSVWDEIEAAMQRK